jgi:hypothetical protein
MKKFQKHCLMVSILILSLFFSSLTCPAQEKNMAGWGMDDPYNRLYDVQEVDTVKAVIRDIKEITPLPGMAPGLGMEIEDKSGDRYLVHICPLAYKDAGSIGLKKGDKIDLRGCLVEIDGKEVIMAAKIKKGEKAVKVRLTSNGKPFWTMSPEELKKELEDN